MTNVRHAAGQRGEDLAAAHLERLGFQILARNHRTRFGELDLVAFDGDVVEIGAGHDAMISRPADLATLIAR